MGDVILLIQDVDGQNRYACACGDARKGLLRAGLTVREAVAADHDRDQRRDLGNRPGEKSLQGGEAGIEGRTARLGLGCEGQQQNCECKDGADVHPNKDEGEWDETTNRNHFAPPLAAQAVSHGAKLMSRS